MKWKQYEVDLLKLHWETKTAKELVDIVNHKPIQIYNKVRRLKAAGYVFKVNPKVIE